MTKNTAAFHISGTMSFMIHLCKMMISPEVFLFFRNVDWIKGQKMAQDDKKLCLSHSISQEEYII